MMLMTLKRISAGLVVLLALLLVSSTRAQTVIVTTVEGRQLEGELVNLTDEQVVLEIAGIRTTLNREDVRQVLHKQDVVRQTYEQRRAALDDADVAGRYELAMYLFQNQAYDLARAELEALAEQDPANEQVRVLLTVLQERQQLAEGERLERPVEELPRATVEPAIPPRLTQEQINIIRVWELPENFPQVGPPVQVPREVAREFLNKYQQQVLRLLETQNAAPTSVRDLERQFTAASDAEKLQTMMQVKAREFYGRVRVASDPPVLRDFRSQLHREYVLNSCATRQCHGSTEAPGGLYLFQQQATSDQTVYTNFYLLNEYVNERGRMIDRQMPAQSLLLQYGLNRASAQRPHPEVRGWRQQFADEQDPRFQRYAEMLGRLYPAATYEIDYELSLTPTEAGEQPSLEEAAPAEGAGEVDAGQEGAETVPAPPAEASEAPAAP